MEATTRTIISDDRMNAITSLPRASVVIPAAYGNAFSTTAAASAVIP